MSMSRLMYDQTPSQSAAGVRALARRLQSMQNLGAPSPHFIRYFPTTLRSRPAALLLLLLALVGHGLTHLRGSLLLALLAGLLANLLALGLGVVRVALGLMSAPKGRRGEGEAYLRLSLGGLLELRGGGLVGHVCGLLGVVVMELEGEESCLVRRTAMRRVYILELEYWRLLWGKSRRWSFGAAAVNV